MGLQSSGSENEYRGLVMTPQRMAELSVLPLDRWTPEEILWTINVQFGYADETWKKKKIWWSQYAKLYVNQYRKENQPDSLGSKLLFTKFNETYSTFATDDVTVEFEPRSLPDNERVANANIVKDYDWDAFNGTTVWNEWLWDALFFGVGILDVSNYDKKRQLLKPTTQNPFLSWFDPMGVDEETSRFFGRYIYADYYSLLNDSRLDEREVKKMANRGGSMPSQQEAQLLYQEAKTVMLGSQYFTEPLMPTGYFEILNWYMKVAGKTYEVFTDNMRRFLLGWQELKYKDNADGTTALPIVIKRYYKMPRQLVGIGVPDLVEDNHRADVKLKNFMYEGIKIDSTPTFLYNYKALLNPKDLSTREINKNVATIENPSGVASPFPKTNVVSSDTLSFLTMNQNEADGAIGSSKIMRGSLSSVKKSATEIAVAKAKQDLQNATRSKEMADAEKRVWNVWLNRHRHHIGEKGTKFVEILGKSGSQEFMEMKGKQFLPKVDPNIKVVSKLMAEPQKVLARRDMAELLKPIADAGGNVREALRQLLYLIDKRKQDIDNLLPPTPHELRAYEENKMIGEEKVPLIHEADDDLQHIAIHMRAEEGKIKDVHVQAHVFNFLRKNNLPDPNKPKDEKENQPSPEVGKEIPQPGVPVKDQRSSPLEMMTAGQKPNMPAVVK